MRQSWEQGGYEQHVRLFDGTDDAARRVASLDPRYCKLIDSGHRPRSSRVVLVVLLAFKKLRFLANGFSHGFSSVLDQVADTGVENEHADCAYGRRTAERLLTRGGDGASSTRCTC